MSIPDLTGLSTTDLEAVRDEATRLLTAAWAVETAQDRAAAVQEEAREALDRIARGWRRGRGGIGSEDSPVAWVAPTGAHDVWPLGAVVAYEGRVWESLVSANAHAPGLSGWREVTTEGAVPEWVQPSGAHDVYAIGDRVTFSGAVYESLIDGNVWSPTDHPAGWKKETP